MKLKAYLEREGIGLAEFGRQIGAKSRATVGRYVSGLRLPSRSMMKRIEKITGGEVDPNDFLSCQPKKRSP